MSIFDSERNQMFAAMQQAQIGPQQGQIGATNTCQEPIRKQALTERAAEELSIQHNRLDALVSELERKLGAVLRPSPACDVTGGAQGEGPGSPLAYALLERAGFARSIADHLDSIIQRVDL